MIVVWVGVVWMVAASHARASDIRQWSTHDRSITRVEQRLGLPLAAAHREAGGIVGESGRWKVGSDGCYWDANDDGPDQCDPNGPTGRYKVDGAGHCYWEPNDSGPAQCAPEPRPVDPGEIEANDGSGAQTYSYADGLGSWLTPNYPSCANLRINGNVGWIQIQTNPSDGSLQWGVGMHSPLENFGLWLVWEQVNGGLLNSKAEWYPPHGSQGALKVPSGAVYELVVRHFYMRTSWIWIFDPGHPEAGGWGGFRPILIQEPAISWGSAICWKF